MKHKIEEVVACYPFVVEDAIQDLDYDQKAKTMRVIVLAYLDEYSDSEQAALLKIYGPFEKYPATESLLVKLTFHGVEFVDDGFPAALEVFAKDNWNYPAWEVSYENGIVTVSFNQEYLDESIPYNELRFKATSFRSERARQRFLKGRHFPLIDIRKQREKNLANYEEENNPTRYDCEGNVIESAEFVSDGFLTKDYFEAIVSELGWREDYQENLNELSVFDEKGKPLGIIHLNKTLPDGSLDYGKDAKDILKDLDGFKPMMKNPVDNVLDFYPEARFFATKLLKRILIDQPDMESHIEGEGKRRSRTNGYRALFKNMAAY
jgi:hypothetical protein